MTPAETQKGLESKKQQSCSLPEQLAGDLAAGTVSAMLISPAITILDR